MLLLSSSPEVFFPTWSKCLESLANIVWPIWTDPSMFLGHRFVTTVKTVHRFEKYQWEVKRQKELKAEGLVRKNICKTSFWTKQPLINAFLANGFLFEIFSLEPQATSVCIFESKNRSKRQLTGQKNVCAS